jgi:hypothetical protein
VVGSYLVFVQTVAKEVLSISFDLLHGPARPNNPCQIVKQSPHPSNIATFNLMHESDPDGFTSRNNLFQSMLELLPLKEPTVNISSLLPEVNQIAPPPVTECLEEANLPSGLYK